MKLNIHILADSISLYLHKVVANESINQNIIGIRLLPNNIADVTKNYLYIASWDKLVDIKQVQSLSVITWDCSDESLLRSRCWSTIVLEEAPDIINLFQYVQSIFDFYNAWSEKIQEAIIEQKSIQSQLDICTQVLQNPIALHDISFVMIARSGYIPPDTDDPIWAGILSKGHGSLEAIPKEYRNITELCCESRTPLAFPPLGTSSEHRFICAALMHDDVPFAHLALTELKVPFTLGQLSLVNHIQHLLEHSMQIPVAPRDFGNGNSYVITQLLHGSPITDELINYSLSRQHWSNSDYFYLIVIQSLQKDEITGSSYFSYIPRIREVMPNSYVIFDNGKVLVIVRSQRKINFQEAIYDTLSPFLHRVDLYAGVSMEYTGYRYLHSAMLQASAALKEGEEKELPERIYRFESIYCKYLVSNLYAKSNPLHFCHPMVEKVHREGNQRDQELLHTLYVYLKNGERISNTAANLHIHRNTLLSRLENIESLLDIKLSLLDENLREILLFSFMIEENLSDQNT